MSRRGVGAVDVGVRLGERPIALGIRVEQIRRFVAEAAVFGGDGEGEFGCGPGGHRIAFTDAR